MRFLIALFFFLIAVEAFSALHEPLQIIPNLNKKKVPYCETHTINGHLRFYTEQSVFLDNLNSQLFVPRGARIEDYMDDPDPVRAIFKDETISFMRLDETSELRNIYYKIVDKDFRNRDELPAQESEKRSKRNYLKKTSNYFFPVKMCGGPQADAIGFFDASELQYAIQPKLSDNSMPPSSKGNRIPQYRRQK